MNKNYYLRELVDVYTTDLIKIYENKLNENFEVYLKHWFEHYTPNYGIEDFNSQIWRLTHYDKKEKEYRTTLYTINRETKKVLYGDCEVGGILEIYRIIFNKKYLFECIQDRAEVNGLDYLLYIANKTKTEEDKKITEIISKMRACFVGPLGIMEENYYWHSTLDERDGYCYIDDNREVSTIHLIYSVSREGYVDKSNVLGITQTPIGILDSENKLQEYTELKNIVRHYSEVENRTLAYCGK